MCSGAVVQTNSKRLHNNRINIKYETTILSNRLMGFFLLWLLCWPVCRSLLFLFWFFFLCSSSLLLFFTRHHCHCLCWRCSFFYCVVLLPWASVFHSWILTECRSLFASVFSIKEMELFARWSAKVWALWIVIIQLAASKCLPPHHSTNIATILLGDFSFGVRFGYGLCECLFLHPHHTPSYKKSHTTATTTLALHTHTDGLKISCCYARQRVRLRMRKMEKCSPEKKSASCNTDIVFSHLPYPISVTVHCCIILRKRF